MARGTSKGNRDMCGWQALLPGALAVVMMLAMAACEYKRDYHKPRTAQRGGSTVVSVPTMDGTGRRCFRLPRALLPTQGDDGFIFNYADVRYLTGESALPGEIGSGRGPFGVVSVDTKSPDALRSYPARGTPGYRLLVEENRYLYVPLTIGQMRSVFITDRKTGLSIRVLRTSTGMKDVAQLEYEARAVEAFVQRAEVDVAECAAIAASSNAPPNYPPP